MAEERGESGARTETSHASRERALASSPCLFCELDRDGRMQWVNSAAESSFGYPSPTIVGHRISTLLHVEDRRRALEAISRADGSSWGPVRLRCESASGSYRRTEWTFTYDEESGRVLAWGRDVSEARNRGRTANEGRAARTPGLFDRILVGVLRVAPNQRVTAANPEMLRLLDDPGSGGVVGASLPNDLFAIGEEFRRLQDQLHDDGTVRGTLAHLRRPEGHRLRVHIDGVRSFDEDGEHLFDELYVRLVAPVDPKRQDPAHSRPAGSARRRPRTAQTGAERS